MGLLDPILGPPGKLERDLGGAVGRANKEIGGVIVKVGDVVNPFVDIDDAEVNEAIRDEEIGVLTSNVVTDQFDPEPGGGFADITIGGAGATIERLAQPIIGPPGETERTITSTVEDLAQPVIGPPGFTERLLRRIGVGGLILVALAIGVIVALGQLFDVQLGGSNS